MDNTLIYIQALEESLKKKIEVFQLLLQANEMQKDQLEADEVDIDTFNQLTTDKEKLIAQIEELDKTFESLFGRIKTEMATDTERYKEQILHLQDMIKSITNIGIKIKVIEQQNKVKLDYFLQKKKNYIKNFKAQSNTAAKYHSNMADQHKGQSYFYDKKK